MPRARPPSSARAGAPAPPAAPAGAQAPRAPAFCGGGGPARPDAVGADRLDPSPAPAVAAGRSGGTLFALRAPVRLAPGRRVTLRYAYGAAQPSAVRRL